MAARAAVVPELFSCLRGASKSTASIFSCLLGPKPMLTVWYAPCIAFSFLPCSQALLFPSAAASYSPLSMILFFPVLYDDLDVYASRLESCLAGVRGLEWS
ncbi:hypothetical protein FGO68_gene2086 [Halteria grandinella]|uniref:Uncharacterized protein n=1 Tax=Halteria grandinella TaxID=5974 RepID=A0A8J8NG38_HALGN|nr:hypothetical protein FGO68_gene2086 [Halteria grandinella]